MIASRRNGQVEYDAFSDHDRAMIDETQFEETTLEGQIESSKYYIDYWMKNYFKNRWENQPYYLEVFIEKKALQGVFEKSTKSHKVGLGACKGYPSLTFLNDTADRMIEARQQGKEPVIVYFGDYDPSGEDIPRSIEENLSKDFGVDVIVDVISLNKQQVLDWNLPPAPAKTTDSRTANWNGLGQVELDAVSPKKLISLCDEAIEKYFDYGLHQELMEQQESEKVIYMERLKEYVNNEL